MPSFDQIREQLAHAGFRMSTQDEGVLCIELSLEQGTRHQAIFLSELEDDDGRPYLRVSTAVAPTTGLDARRALVFNWQSRVGYLAIGDLDGVPYLQLGERYRPDVIAVRSRAWMLPRPTAWCWRSAASATGWSARSPPTATCSSDAVPEPYAQPNPASSLNST